MTSQELISAIFPIWDTKTIHDPDLMIVDRDYYFQIMCPLEAAVCRKLNAKYKEAA